MAVQVVPYADRFLEGVRDLIVPIQREEFGIPITYEDQPDLQDVSGFYGRGRGGFWVALDGSDVVGSIALVDIGTKRAALRKMFVKKTYRGKARGTAGKLLDRLLAHAWSAGIEEVYLGTTAAFRAAHRFYEKAGFQEIDETGLPASFPRMSVDTRFYRLLITAEPGKA